MVQFQKIHDDLTVFEANELLDVLLAILLLVYLSNAKLGWTLRTLSNLHLLKRTYSEYK